MTFSSAFLDPTSGLNASHQLSPVILQATPNQVSLFPHFTDKAQRGGKGFAQDHRAVSGWAEKFTPDSLTPQSTLFFFFYGLWFPDQGSNP